jgi:hypothetical protein
MARDGSGTYTRTDGTRSGTTTWTKAKNAAVKIISVDHDTHDQDIADALTQSVSKDGQTVMTGSLDMGTNDITNAGGFAGSGSITGLDLNIGGGSISGTSASISGGTGNNATGAWAHVGGGSGNQATGDYSAISGGALNTAGGDYTFSSGKAGESTGDYSFTFGNSSIAGGQYAVSIGLSNDVSGVKSLAIGDSNNVSGDNAYALGVSCNVSGNSSYGFGTRAKPTLTGQFVISDAAAFDWSNTVDTGRTWLLNQMNLRFANGYNFCTGYNGSGVPSSGVQALAGTNAWSTLSDENKKTNFKEINHIETLNKVSDMYVSDWQYKTDAKTKKHYYGPTAQDFHRIFNLGGDKLSIDTQQNIGVLYSAVKGLINQVDALKDEIKSLTK